MSGPYISSAERCRRALASAGYTRRQVTVRDDGNYMCSSIKVTVRDASVRRSAVEAIAKQVERIDRDSMTGEILSGGNTFVDVAYLDAITGPLVDAIEAAIVAAPNGQRIGVAGASVAATFDRAIPAARHHATVLRFDADGVGEFYCMGVRHAARQLAIAWLDGGHGAADPLAPAPADAWLDRLALDDEQPRPMLSLVP